MSEQSDLIDRVRRVLEPRTAVEKKMFGGVSFLLDGRLALAAGKDGDLLVRVLEERSEELLARPGVQMGEMGGRSMGPRWLVVDAEHITRPDELPFWVEQALDRLSLEAS